jgi:hypothetical protein
LDVDVAQVLDGDLLGRSLAMKAVSFFEGEIKHAVLDLRGEHRKGGSPPPSPSGLLAGTLMIRRLSSTSVSTMEVNGSSGRTSVFMTPEP